MFDINTKSVISNNVHLSEDRKYYYDEISKSLYDFNGNIIVQSDLTDFTKYNHGLDICGGYYETPMIIFWLWNRLHAHLYEDDKNYKSIISSLLCNRQKKLFPKFVLYHIFDLF